MAPASLYPVAFPVPYSPPADACTPCAGQLIAVSLQIPLEVCLSSSPGLNPLSDERPAEIAGRLKNIFGGSIGNLLEWYDFYVYNSFALYFAKFFFNSKDPTAQFLTVFGIYAIAFFIRPVGGVLLGGYADRAGRRAALTLSVMRIVG